jgi:tRNA(Ile)-lysidine synthetase-like protein
MSLLSIIPFWFQSNASKEIWFQKNIQKKQKLDRYITNEYYLLLKYIENIKLLDLITTYNTNELISIIICLDQFSRHIYRGLDTKNGIIYKNTQLSLEISNYLCYSKKIVYIDEKYIPFILMPYKHIDILCYFKHIYNILEKKKMIDSLFYKDCLTKYVLNNKHLLNTLPNNFSQAELLDVCDYYPEQNTFIKIDQKLNINPLYKICKNFIKKIQTDTLIISLSGGVDSMVLTYILCILCSEYNINFKAFHINYGNREISTKEQYVVYNFCKKLNIPIYIHKIDYLKRCNSERSYYEKITRKIRFNFYKFLGGNIILGHIQDDLIENIWTNFTKGENLFKLHKMDEISHIEDVWIMRPFISVEKKEILEFAHCYNIPFLKNTTPEWSNRGKLRNIFLSDVEKQFGKNVNNKILDVSRNLESYWNILEQKIFIPFYKSIRYIDIGIIVNIRELKDMNVHFWQTIFNKIYHKMELNIPSISSIKNFLNRFENSKLGLIIMKSSTYTYIDLNYDLYILELSKLSLLIDKDINKVGINDWKWIRTKIV